MLDRTTLEARIRYHSHRGMLELDLILVPFTTKHLSSLTLEELITLDELLESQDPDLHAWLMSITQPGEPRFVPLIERMRKMQ